MQDTIEIDLKELFLVLFKKLPWIILTVLIGTAAAFGITRYLIPPEYTSEISLYVNNVTQDGQVATSVNLNDINASQKLVNTYIVILQNDEVLNQVAEGLTAEFSSEWLQTILPFSETPDGSRLEAKTLRKVISMSAVNNTEVLKIEAETKNANVSARICTLITEVAPEVLQRVVKAGSVEVIGEAVPAYVPSSPRLMLNCVIGFLLGGVVSVLYFLIRHFLDTSIKDGEDLKKRFDLPILGEIPDFNASQKGGYTYGS